MAIVRTMTAAGNCSADKQARVCADRTCARRQTHLKTWVRRQTCNNQIHKNSLAHRKGRRKQHTERRQQNNTAYYDTLHSQTNTYRARQGG